MVILILVLRMDNPLMTFLIDLKNKAQTCEFENLQDSCISDSFWN